MYKFASEMHRFNVFFANQKSHKNSLGSSLDNVSSAQGNHHWYFLIIYFIIIL